MTLLSFSSQLESLLEFSQPVLAGFSHILLQAQPIDCTDPAYTCENITPRELSLVLSPDLVTFLFESTKLTLFMGVLWLADSLIPDYRF